MESLVTTEWLADHLDDADLLLVDSSWHMPASGRSGREEFLAAHIPGARFFDIDEVSDRSDPAPHRSNVPSGWVTEGLVGAISQGGYAVGTATMGMPAPP